MRILFLLLILSFSSQSTADGQFGFSVIKTANSAGTLEAMVVSGGDLTEIRRLAHVAVLVEHPQGNFLWDTGLGTELESQMETFGFLDQQLFKVENHKPARSQLDQANYDIKSIDMIIPSHMHWDHVSGLEDFSPTPVWVQQGSIEEANAGEPPAFVASQFDSPDIHWKFITLEDGPYEGFEMSMDIFGDGRVVLVDTTGHSDGHLGLFLNFSGDERYFLIGDTAWVHEGIEHNASRPWLVKALVGVDKDFDQNAKVLAHMHALFKEKPGLQFVPAHDENVLENLPIFPEFRRVSRTGD